MTSSLFDDPGMTHRGEDPVDHRAVRRLALGGALQLVRTRNGWNVTQAASHAGLAPMTVRRVEDGLPVRERSYAALDRLLDLSFGTVKRALADDMLMVEVVKLAGVDTRRVAADNAAEFLAEFGEQTRTDSPRQNRVLGHQWSDRSAARRPGPWPAVDDATRRALAEMSQHVPPNRPTDLQLVQQMVDQLTRQPVTPAIDELVQVALKAMPDLIARQLEQAEEDIRAARDNLQQVVPEQTQHDDDREPADA